MGAYLRNSLVAIVGSVVIDLLLAIPAAYSLARYRYRFREDIGFYILSTRMMAPAIVAIPIFFLFRTIGPARHGLGADADLCGDEPVARHLDHPLLHARHPARDRGCGAHRRRDRTCASSCSIIMPMCLPGIITAAVIAVIFAINEFLFTLLIASTKNAYTLSVALANFTGGSDGIIYNAIAMVAFLAFVPVLLLVIAIQKHLSRGLTMGAVKG